MNDDELRARLAARDPQAGAPVAPIRPEQLERAMSTTTRRTPLVAAAAAAALLVGGGVTALSLRDQPADRTTQEKVLALKDPGSNAMASCVMLTPDVLRGQELAFAGTVRSIDDGTATLDVTHWFKGGDADVVTVGHDSAGTMSESLTLEQGKRYLIATTGDALSLCTGSGEETPELRKLFDEAFA